MRVAVIGKGKIGGTLGRALAQAGHEVSFGSRNAAGAAAGDDVAAATSPAALPQL